MDSIINWRRVNSRNTDNIGEQFNKKEELLTLREHIGSPNSAVFDVVSVATIFSLFVTSSHMLSDFEFIPLQSLMWFVLLFSLVCS
jgi:hypothetical protein